jgi:hypothetical protein
MIALLLLVPVLWLVASRSDGFENWAQKPARFAGPLDSTKRIDQAELMTYKLEEMHKWFGLSPAETAETEVVTTQGSEPGDERSFEITDDPTQSVHVITATLAYTGSTVQMYVDQEVEVEVSALQEAARVFAEAIVPINRAAFGMEENPAEPITILHTNLEHAGGYYVPIDPLSQALAPTNNPRKLIVIGVNSYPPGTEGYLSILAHEFQHMIHAHQQPGSPSWFNEGLSTLAQDLQGYPDDELGVIYLAEPGIGLTGWSQDAAETGSHYGAANLFLRYFMEHYAAECDLNCLIRADAGNRHEVFTQSARATRPDIESFSDLVADWAVANVINDPEVGDGRYTYEGLPGYAGVEDPGRKRVERSVEQFGVDYLGVLEGPLTITFDGEDAVSLTGAQPHSGEWMWWSNRGDGRYATLTREFDLSDVSTASLEFSAWYEIERHYDYGYVTVSTDQGATWQTLPGKTTTQENPQEQNLGHGLTGISGHESADVGQEKRGRWVEEELDLTPFAGQSILLRFWLVYDAAFNGPGLLIDQICIPAIDYCDGAEDETGGWQSVGFVRTTGHVPQEWELRLAVRSDSGLLVRDVALNAQNRAEIRLDAGEQAVLMILGATSHTNEPASYEVEVSRQ